MSTSPDPAKLEEADSLILWSALDTAHQMAINLQLAATTESERKLRLDERNEIFNALNLLETKCSHMPSIQHLAVTLKKTFVERRIAERRVTPTPES